MQAKHSLAIPVRIASPEIKARKRLGMAFPSAGAAPIYIAMRSSEICGEKLAENVY